MLLLAILALCVLAALATVWPLLRAAPEGVDEPTAGEAAALRAALAENEADRAAARIAPAEADAVRAEVGRRLLALERERSGRTAGQAGGDRRVPVAAALLAPIGAVALYALLGTPDPTRAVAATDGSDGPALVARAEAALAQRPDDARGWLAIAPAYRSLGRLEDAEAAFRKAAAGLEGSERGAALTGLADLVSARSGAVTEEARDLAAEALAIDPTNASAAFLLTLHADANRPPSDALPVWRDLVARFGPSGPPWLAAAERRIAELESAPGNPALTEAGRAIAAASAAERAAMIEGMVDGLAARLADAPDDPEGWARLVRSYRVLERPEQADRATRTARAALTGDGLARFESLLAGDATTRASTRPGDTE